MAESETISKEQAAIATQKLDTPGAGFDRWWLLVFAVVAVIIFLSVMWPNPFAMTVQSVSDGIVVTIYVTAISYVLIVFVGLLGGLGRLSRNPVIKGIATLYVEILRGIPLLVQLIFWYFAFPSVIQRVGDAIHFEPFSNYLANPVAMAVIGLTICYGAYMSEIYRAGIQSISKGQMEAAKSIGMNYFQAMRFIILPQAVRRVLPPLGNDFIACLKDSSLVSVIAVNELTQMGKLRLASTFRAMETYNMVAFLYLSMTLLLSSMVRGLERKMKIEE